MNDATRFSMLIPELAEWNNGKGIDLESWIRTVGRYDHAIGYSAIFWPDFVEYDDCVFRSPMPEASYKKWQDTLGNDKSAIEAVANHEHILDLFVNSEFRPSRDVVLHIGSTLKTTWSCKLKMDFPRRRFEVKFPYNEDAVELIDYEITFFQTR